MTKINHDQDQDLSRVAHIGRNHKGDTKLLVTLPIATRLKMLVVSEACAVSQQWLVAKGVLCWSAIVRVAADLRISPLSIQEEFQQYLAHRDEFRKFLAQKAEAKPKPVAKAEARKPEPASPRPRRGGKGK
jgi:hypothetical protein